MSSQQLLPALVALGCQPRPAWPAGAVSGPGTHRVLKACLKARRQRAACPGAGRWAGAPLVPAQVRGRLAATSAGLAAGERRPDGRPRAGHRPASQRTRASAAHAPDKKK